MSDQDPPVKYAAALREIYLNMTPGKFAQFMGTSPASPNRLRRWTRNSTSY